MTFEPGELHQIRALDEELVLIAEPEQFREWIEAMKREERRRR